MLTVAEAAEIVGVHRSTVIAMLEDDRLEGHVGDPGTRPRYLVEAASAEALRDAGRERTHANERVPPAENRSRDELPLYAREPASGVWDDTSDDASDDQLVARVQALEAENRRLREVARAANSALSLQTEALQQFLIDDTMPS